MRMGSRDSTKSSWDENLDLTTPQFLSQIHALVTKFVLEFLCLTVALLPCPPAQVEPSMLCHKQYLRWAQDICGDSLLLCQGFMAENGALPNAASLAGKLLGPVWLQLFGFLLCPFSLLDFPTADGKQAKREGNRERGGGKKQEQNKTQGKNCKARAN